MQATVDSVIIYLDVIIKKWFLGYMIWKIYIYVNKNSFSLTENNNNNHRHYNKEYSDGCANREESKKAIDNKIERKDTLQVSTTRHYNKRVFSFFLSDSWRQERESSKRKMKDAKRRKTTPTQCKTTQDAKRRKTQKDAKWRKTQKDAKRCKTQKAKSQHNTNAKTKCQDANARPKTKDDDEKDARWKMKMMREIHW